MRIVVKIGTSSVTDEHGAIKNEAIRALCEQVARVRGEGNEVIVVTSGAIAGGVGALGLAQRPTDTQTLQALAAVGQSQLMNKYNEHLATHGLVGAQVLLVPNDFIDRTQYLHARQTLVRLLELGCVPIINENDAVTADKLKVGDNDNLSAMVAAAADADTLVICSDVDGLYDQNPHEHPNAKLIKQVTEINADIYAMAGGASSDVGTGGMRTKIQAAEKAISHGIETFIINGFNADSFSQLLKGQNPGTLFTPYEKPMQEHLHWMTHTSQAQGEVIVEDDFDLALDQHSEQLTSDDVVEVKGDFSVGDTILVRKGDGTKLAKAKSNYSSCLLSFITEQDDQAFASEFQQKTGPIISDKNIAILKSI